MGGEGELLSRSMQKGQQDSGQVRELRGTQNRERDRESALQLTTLASSLSPPSNAFDPSLSYSFLPFFLPSFIHSLHSTQLCGDPHQLLHLFIRLAVQDLVQDPMHLFPFLLSVLHTQQNEVKDRKEKRTKANRPRRAEEQMNK
mmetsp:Transcript_45667/g.89953  ORF Transcript_45667/g.89953 Transcript_45667/m.89953 type:complete len:144 (-) Transcript_45667:2142-2573(-)